MSKRFNLFLLGCMLCAVGLLTAAPALAGVSLSRHDVVPTGNTYTALRNIANYGTCSACHIPHGAGADKLFPSAGPTATGGHFGPLCGSCHDSGVVGMSGLPNININTTVFVANAHGLRVADITAMGGDYSTSAAGLKYRTLAESPRTTQVNEIECLSCHDVHNQNSNRPFLAVPLNTLCQLCHTNRESATAAASGYANALGNHPSGAAFTGDLLDNSGVANNGTSGNSPFNATPQLWGTELVNWTDTGTDGSTWTDGVWDSGMKLTTGATGGGVGCTACHNVHFDETDATPDNGTFYLGIVDDGLPGAANLFCEYCHQGSLTIPTEMGGGTAATRWNPGYQTYSHPNDGVGAQQLQSSDLTLLPLGITAPTSDRSGSGASALICTSCHGVHRQDATTADTQPNSPNLLRFGAVTLTGVQVRNGICTACHGSTYAGFNHHPVGTVYATAGNNANGVTCSGGDLGAGVGTCHGGGSGGGAAHNRTSAINVVDTTYSGMCVTCHTVNPSVYTPNRAYTANGSASHYVGDAATTTITRTTGSTAIRYAGSGTSATPTAEWLGSTEASKFGANDTTIICESCHSLKAGNLVSGDGATAMLLEVSGSATTICAADSVAPAYADYGGFRNLCTGCHLAPAGTHPLSDATSSVYPIVSGAGQTYTTAGAMNCESCHSAHDADTDMGSFILDGGGTGSGTTGMEVEPWIDYTDFCAVCHSNFK